MPAALALRAAVVGTVEAQVDDSLGRQAVVVRSTSDRRRGALSAADGDTIALAARAARQSGVPLVLVLASSGADVIDGVDALVGWGRAAKELVAERQALLTELERPSSPRWSDPRCPARRCCSGWPTSW